MHLKVRAYLSAVKQLFPKHFEKSYVLDVGSADINGNFRDLSVNCNYIGIDIRKTKNVDIVVNINDYNPGKKFDTIFSVEMLEHDKTRKDSLNKMYSLLKKGGLLVVTCAGIGRREHGVTTRGPSDSPATNDYYRNLDTQDILSILPGAVIEEDDDRPDIRFYIIKS